MNSRFDQPDHNPADDTERYDDSIDVSCKRCGCPVTIYGPEMFATCDDCWRTAVETQDRKIAASLRTGAA